jgi:hypothetical protein
MITDAYARGEPVVITSGDREPGESATRRMCAGVVMDALFRDELLRKVYNDRTRRVAPSYGFNLVIVLRYAWRAWWLDLALRCALLAALAIALVEAPLRTVIALSGLTLWFMVRKVPAWADGLTNYYYHGEGPESDIRRIESNGRTLGFAALASLVIFTICMALSLSASNRAGSTASWVSKAGLTGGAIITVAWASLVAAAALVRLFWLRQLRNADPGEPRRLGRRMRVINAQQSHPLTVYSGLHPFIGSGTTAVSWSFAQRLVKEKTLKTGPDVEYEVPPFTTADLMGELRLGISQLCEDRDPETALRNLDVGDGIFVEGTNAIFSDLIGMTTFDERAVQTEICRAITNPGGAVRHYLACRVPSWGGEIVTSVYVHASLQGRTLYLEFATLALLPIRHTYQQVDKPSTTGPAALARKLGKSLVSLPQELQAIQSIIDAPAQVWSAIRPRPDLTLQRQANARADIGANMSAREAAAVEAKRSYFQTQDILQHSKIIERRLIATVGDFLMKHHVDTTEFLQRATAILNNGVINTGSGNVDISDSVFGENNTNVTSDPPPAPGE